MSAPGGSDQPPQAQRGDEAPAFGAGAAPPSLSLPKAGGALRGIGETFAVNPSTGTASLSLTFPTSPARQGCEPKLALRYDSGAGNGPFGLGWNLGVPSITRKTDRGLPRYDDEAESDVFILSGAEDLVPVAARTGTGVRRHRQTRTDAQGRSWIVRRYRPRTEGMFARIERWTEASTGIGHWRTISRQGVVSVFGRTPESRVADPLDPAHVFSWAICESWDLYGNAAVYRYVAEDAAGVDRAAAHEHNRDDAARGTQRYLKRVLYGNVAPRAADEDLLARGDWLFEVVLDYGDHRAEAPQPAPDRPWPCREDPFSSHRAGFEVRTYRACRRLLMFHHFPDEAAVGRASLVRSLALRYRASAVASHLVEVVLRGHRRRADGSVVTRSLPPVTLDYTRPAAPGALRDVDASSLENLPAGLAGSNCELVDLHGDGAPGVLTEDGGGWFYKRNLSGTATGVRFGPMQREPLQPLAAQDTSRRLLDVDGDGRLEVVTFAPPAAGFHEHENGGWGAHVPFASLPALDWDDPNLRFVDLTGDGRADVLLTSESALTWFESLGAEGFAAGARVAGATDEQRGPRLVFADGTQTIHLADMSGDGLADLVRIGNGEVSYWPNLGYGRFGRRVAMDAAPRFDRPGQFDPRRVRVADVDGSGPADLIYLGPDGIDLYVNRSGNGWSGRRRLPAPPVPDPGLVTVADLLGAGTACLVWSSGLPGDARGPLRYLDLTGASKPHLLERVDNGLGSTTAITYASSTEFEAADRAAGRPWITRLPFPVQVVRRVEVVDAVSGNRFVASHAYHHGHFDGDDREFRGFGCVETWDTAEFDALDGVAEASNLARESHVAPLLTRTWFHTGAHLDAAAVSRQFAGEYYREGDPGDGLDAQTAAQRAAMALPDSTLPATLLAADGTRTPHALTVEEEREARRALRGSVLRQETYACDGTDAEDRPYLVSERSYAVELLQPRLDGRAAVLFVRPRESVELHYERTLFEVGGKRVADPRVDHSLTLAIDGWGNPLRVARAAYGRRHADRDPDLQLDDRAVQSRTVVSWTDSGYTPAVDQDDAHRAPLPADVTGYELHGAAPAGRLAGTTNLFRIDELAAAIATASQGGRDIPYEQPSAPASGGPYRRIVEAGRMLYRADDLTGPLPLGQAGLRGHPWQGYRLAFTAGLIASAYRRGAEALVPDPGATLGTEGGYARGDDLRAAGSFPATDPAGRFWMPSGRTWFSADPSHGPAQELAVATRAFFQPSRYEDPFGGRTTVERDRYQLLTGSIVDPVGNVTRAANDYRVLRARLLTDPNGNRAAALFDALGLVTATAVMGKSGQTLGDSLEGLEADPSETALAAHFVDPSAGPHALLGRATSRTVYDLQAFVRTRGDAQPQPAGSCTIVRETHDSDLAAGARAPVIQRFEYTDGFARVIQRKGPAEPGPVTEGGPSVASRWVGTGWTVFNNKGDPVRRYEPFFSATHRFEPARTGGVSSVLIYDPARRPVATLHPDRSWEKLVIDPWRQEQWDVVDTCAQDDPADDPHVGRLLARLPRADYTPTWAAARVTGAMGARERAAAEQARAHAGTPTVVHFDPLGRPFVTFAHNRFEREGATVEERYRNRSVLDLEGNRLAFVDARGRTVVSAAFGLLGGRLRETGMDSGTRWLLADAAGKPLYVWDSQGRRMRTHYDAARRPTTVELRAADGTTSTVQRTVYGESAPNARRDNLRGHPYRSFDGAGQLTQSPRDFKGNVLSTRRRLAVGYRAAPDWSGSVALEPPLEQRTAYDALDRPTASTTPDGSVVRHAYNVAGLLESVRATVRGESTPRTYVEEIDYDAKGQRLSILYGNGVRTQYTYDPLTWRLIGQRSRRGSGYPGDCPDPAGTPCGVQNLSFVYDCAGNVVSVVDAAQPTIFFNGAVVDATGSYAYDATYRLVVATGREHVTAGDGAARVLPVDGAAMQRYRERYAYDAVGNLLEVAHRGTDAGSAGWRRTYHYSEPSLVDPAQTSNRLSETRVGTDVERYAYDPHGSMTSIGARLPLMQWDHADHLARSARQMVAPGAAAETTYYAYDNEGNRVRKVTDTQAAAGGAPRRVREHVYACGMEIHRRYGPDGSVTLERQTLPVLDEDRRVALVETRTRGSDGTPAQLERFQLEAQVGSVAVELGRDGRAITYEEYYPWGGTSLDGTGNQAAASKRYRWAAKERDEESGLYRYGERYYAAWLGRWTSCDPAGARDSPNVYSAFRNAPTRYVDPTGRENEEFTEAGSGYARREFAINVDESKAVGEPGISEQEAMRRAKDLSARQFLDQTTNSATKGAGSERPIMERTKLPPTSVAENPGALISRPTLGGIKEWDELSEHIMKKTAHRFEGKTALQVKEILNSAIREELKAPTTAPGRAISDALSKQLGKPPKDLFKGKTIGKLRWRGGGGGKFGAVVAAVGAALTLTSAEAAAEEFHVEPPQSVAEGRPMTIEEGAQLQLQASTQVAEMASVVPGGLLAAAWALSKGAEALEMHTTRKEAQLNGVRSNLHLVQNAWLMINPGTGEVFAISRGQEGEPARGTLTSLGHFDRYALLPGQYWRNGEVIQKDAQDRYWLGDTSR